MTDNTQQLDNHDCALPQSGNNTPASSPLIFNSWEDRRGGKAHHTPNVGRKTPTNSPGLPGMSMDMNQFTNAPSIGQLPPFRNPSDESGGAERPSPMPMVDDLLGPENMMYFRYLEAAGVPINVNISMGGKGTVAGSNPAAAVSLGAPHPAGASLHTLEFNPDVNMPALQMSDVPPTAARGISGSSEGMMELALRELNGGAPPTAKRQRSRGTTSSNAAALDAGEPAAAPARATRSSSRTRYAFNTHTGRGSSSSGHPRQSKRRAVESAAAVPKPSSIGTIPLSLTRPPAATVRSEPTRRRSRSLKRTGTASAFNDAGSVSVSAAGSSAFGAFSAAASTGTGAKTGPKYKYVKPKSLGGQSLLGLAEEERWQWFEDGVVSIGRGVLRQFAYWPPNSPVEELTIMVTLPGQASPATSVLQYRGTPPKAGTHVRKGSSFARVEKPFTDGSGYVMCVSSVKPRSMFLHQDRRLKRTNELALKKGEEGHDTVVAVFVQDTPITFAVKDRRGRLVSTKYIEFQWQVEKNGKSKIFHREVPQDVRDALQSPPSVDMELELDDLDEVASSRAPATSRRVAVSAGSVSVKAQVLPTPPQQGVLDQEDVDVHMGSVSAGSDEFKLQTETKVASPTHLSPTANMLSLPSPQVCKPTSVSSPVSAAAPAPSLGHQRRGTSVLSQVDDQDREHDQHNDLDSVASFETMGRIQLYPKLVDKPMVGRNLSFAQLVGKLGEPDGAANTKIVNIYGRKGIGKTQFLQYYAHKMKDKYHSVLWLDMKHFQESWDAIVASLHTTPQLARRAFQKHLFQNPCSLLVVDRVDANARFMNCPFLKSLLNPETNNSFMPQKGLHAVLISRIPLNWSLEVRAQMPLVPMKLPSLYQTSQELLEQSCGKKIDPSEAKKVVGLLNHVPALIVSFSEHIRKGLISVDEFMRQTFQHMDAVTLDPDKEPSQSKSNWVLRCPAGPQDAAEKKAEDDAAASSSAPVVMTGEQLKTPVASSNPPAPLCSSATTTPAATPTAGNLNDALANVPLGVDLTAVANARGRSPSRLVAGLAKGGLPDGFITPPLGSPLSRGSAPPDGNASDIDCFSSKSAKPVKGPSRKCLPVNTRKSSTLYTLGLQDIFNKHPEYFNLAVLELCAAVEGGSLPVNVIKSYNHMHVPTGMIPRDVAEKVEDYMRLLAGIDIGKIHQNAGYESSFQLSKIDYHLIRRYIQDNENPEETRVTKARLFQLVLSGVAGNNDERSSSRGSREAEDNNNSQSGFGFEVTG